MVQNIKWTDVMIEQMRTMANAGASTREIAEALYDPAIGISFTRNMIIGKARREGIPLKVISAPHIVRHQKEPAKQPSPKAAKPSMPVIASSPITGAVAPSEKDMTPVERLTYRQREHARVLDFIERTKERKAAGGVPFMKRHVDECAYLLGTGHLSMVCGKPVERRSYCAEHAKLCYTVTPRMSGVPAADMSVKRVKVEEKDEDDADTVDLMLEDAASGDEAFPAL